MRVNKNMEANIVKFIRLLYLLAGFLSLDVIAAHNDDGNWANNIIQTYTVPDDAHREQAIVALRAVPHDARGWVLQKANQLIPVEQRHLRLLGFYFNSDVLLGLATLALSAESRLWFGDLGQTIGLRADLTGRENISTMRLIPPNARAWTLAMARSCAHRCPQAPMLLSLLLAVIRSCNNHNPPVDLVLFRNTFIGILEREPAGAFQEGRLMELLMEAQRQLGLR
jgi:hypothetical protein